MATKSETAVRTIGASGTAAASARAAARMRAAAEAARRVTLDAVYFLKGAEA